MTKLLTVGKHKIMGHPVFIENARKGLSCDAVCPSCGRNLEARQGKTYEWFFAHDNSAPVGPPCVVPFETALHFVAKWIISRGTRIKLPGDKYFEYDHATVEKWVDRYRVDVYLLNTTTNQSLLVEIVVCHPLEEEKIEGLHQLGHEPLEIDLSGYEGNLPEKELTSLLLDTTYGKTLHKRRLSLPKLPIPTFIPFPAIVISLLFLVGLLFLGKSPKK